MSESESSQAGSGSDGWRQYLKDLVLAFTALDLVHEAMQRVIGLASDLLQLLVKHNDEVRRVIDFLMKIFGLLSLFFAVFKCAIRLLNPTQ